MFDKLKIYQKLPYSLKVVAASIHGYNLKRWRYSRETEKLVREASEREYWSNEQWKNWQEEQLTFILNRAIKKVPYYRDQWCKRKRQGDRASHEYLENWPVLNKDEVRKHAHSFIADDCNFKKMFPEHTSGTTGTPLHLWWSHDTVIKWYALFEARWRRWYGISYHDRWGIFGGQVIVPYTQSKPPFWVWNEGLNQLYLSVMHISPSSSKYYLDALYKYNLKYLFGYTNSLYALALEAQKYKYKFNFKVIITNAEPLFKYQRDLIKKVFNCPVRETYGLAEITCAAGECEKGSFHWWPDAGILETLQFENDKKLSSKKIGRLVSTGLINPDMPLIRYDTKDSIHLDNQLELCKCSRTLPCFGRVIGRKDDVIFTKEGRVIVQIDTIFDPELHIKEAQIIQEKIDFFYVKVVPANGWSTIDSEKIYSALRKRVGNVKIEVKVVDKIEKTWAGKFRIILSKLKDPKYK